MVTILELLDVLQNENKQKLQHYADLQQQAQDEQQLQQQQEEEEQLEISNSVKKSQDDLNKIANNDDDNGIANETTQDFANQLAAGNQSQQQHQQQNMDGIINNSNLNKDGNDVHPQAMQRINEKNNNIDDFKWNYYYRLHNNPLIKK